MAVVVCASYAHQHALSLSLSLFLCVFFPSTPSVPPLASLFSFILSLLVSSLLFSPQSYKRTGITESLAMKWKVQAVT